MNYHQARQRTDGSGWAWTTMNDGIVHTSGGCVTWPQGAPVTIEDSIGPSAKPMGEPHSHPTREAAERCFWEYEAVRLRPFASDPDTQRRCQYTDPRMAVPSCPNWTSKGLSARLLGEADLCDAHCDADGWRSVHPFEPGVSITASW